jgi:hypothetical protein
MGYGPRILMAECGTAALEKLESEWLPFAPSVGMVAVRQLQYLSCSRTQLMVPSVSLRPFGARSSQLNAPINSSEPR